MLWWSCAGPLTIYRNGPDYWNGLPEWTIICVLYTGTILLFTLFDLDLDDVVRVALWLKLSLPGGKNISGSMLFTYMTELELK